MPAPATLLECPVKYLLTSFFRHPAGGQDHGAGGGARGGGGRGSGGDAEQAGGPPQLEKREALGSHGPPPPHSVELRGIPVEDLNHRGVCQGYHTITIHSTFVHAYSQSEPSHSFTADI